jgi:hypothetical protein
LRGLVVAAVACAAPVALVLDLVARHFVVGGQPPDVQQFLAVEVTRFAWFAIPGPVLGGLLGFQLYPRLHRRALARARGPAVTGPDPAAEQRADLEALLFATTLAQLPALFGDLAVMLGARLLPALCTTSLSTLAVVAIGVLARPAGARADRAVTPPAAPRSPGRRS